MCGSSMVNSSWRSVRPENGTHLGVVGSYFEICVVYTCESRAQEGKTCNIKEISYNLIIDGVHLWRRSLSDLVVGCVVDAQHACLLKVHAAMS